MLSFIDKVRERNIYERKLIALSIAGGITAVILAVWLFTIPARIASIENNDTKHVVETRMAIADKSIESNKGTGIRHKLTASLGEFGVRVFGTVGGAIESLNLFEGRFEYEREEP